MNLAVDIGNTRTKVAYVDRNRNLVVTALHQVAEAAPIIHQQNITQGILSSVQQNETVLVWKDMFPQVSWLELSAHTPVPFTNHYLSPNTLGLDRIALAAAAATQFKGVNTLVVDAGTCITYDVITANGAYVGGAIAPGLQMRLDAMHHFTARLPKISLNEHATLVGNTTETCMQSGALHGFCAEVEGMIANYQEQFHDLHIVLTGGNAKTLASLLKNNIFARPNFLLEGLHVILAYNTL